MNTACFTKVVKDIRTDDCEISMRAGGKNYVIAECSAVVKVSEKEHTIGPEGMKYQFVDREYSLLLCNDMRYFADITLKTLEEAIRYDVKFGIDVKGQKKYVLFENIRPVRIDLYGEWEFKLSEQDGALLLDSIE